ncbi:AraC family transcriptional regulator [Pseudomonas hunanensis]|uniref:AraC family transcriptional regulator n=1 Tax=Pseudomonas hunanensis TaxID=1247546 RepID=UPI00314529D3
MEAVMYARTTSASWALEVVRLLENFGLDCISLLAELGVEYSALDDPQARLTQDTLTRLWRKAVEVSGDPSVGLALGRAVGPRSFHVVGLAMMTSDTLRQGFERLVRYQRVMSEGAELSLVSLTEGEALILGMQGDRLPVTRHSIEAPLAGVLSIARALSGQTLCPVKVLMVGPRPADIGSYRAMFRSPLYFNASDYALIFKREDVEKPLRSANPEIARCNDALADDYLRGLSGSRVTYQVRRVLRKLLSEADATRQRVASELCVSGRTLQRRLLNEGVSFHALLDCTRRELALEYMAQSDVPLVEIAERLGFSDATSFNRAFRRWFDISPGRYRNLLNQDHENVCGC